MHEASKALTRRLYDSRFATRYFVGNGIDIGAGPDPLGQYVEQFPAMLSCRSWDIADGDAQYLATIDDESMDFVHSSHCLEHMPEPGVALENWLRVVKPGGHVIVTIPDEDLYEQGVFPSTFNTDHKCTFTMHKNLSWSPKSVNLLSLLLHFTGIAQILKVEQIDAGYRFKLPRYDQTLTTASECALEFILRKLPPEEILRKGRLPAALPVAKSTTSGATPIKVTINSKTVILAAEEAIQTALAQSRSGNYPVAETIYQQLISTGVASAEIFKNYGNTLLSLNRRQEAEQYYRLALELKPDYAEAFNNLGNLLRLEKRFTESEAAFHQAVTLLPGNAEVHNNFGSLFMSLGRLEDAEKAFRQAILLRPDFTMAYRNRGDALRAIGRLSVAEKSYRKAIELDSEYVDAYAGLGQTLLHLGNTDEAEEVFLRSLELRPAYAISLIGLGNTYLAKGLLDMAESSYLQAISISPDYLSAQFNLSILKLLKGDFAEGFKHYETRFSGGSINSFRAINDLFKQFTAQKRWTGEQVAGMNLFIITEQGAGDSLMMMRYLPLLKQRGFERILVFCEPELVRVFQSMAGVDEVFSKAEPFPPAGFDFYCPMMSLPYLFQTGLHTIPDTVPYLHVSATKRKKWRSILAAVSGLKVGLAWAGSNINLIDKKRSIPLSKFSPVFNVGGIRLISLQKGVKAAEIKELGSGVTDCIDLCDDYLDTASLIAELDLVISVDTSVVHLAGALGKPVWLLNRFESEWRWMISREDSPWYPTMKIFNQKQSGDWESVISHVASELKKLV